MEGLGTLRLATLSHLGPREQRRDLVERIAIADGQRQIEALPHGRPVTRSSQAL